VIVSGSSQAIAALHKATTGIPIVMATSGDPIRSDFVRKLVRPRGNITGLSNLTSDIGAKQWSRYTEWYRSSAACGCSNKSYNSSLVSFLKNVQSASRMDGVNIVPLDGTAHEMLITLSAQLLEPMPTA